MPCGARSPPLLPLLQLFASPLIPLALIPCSAPRCHCMNGSCRDLSDDAAGAGAGGRGTSCRCSPDALRGSGAATGVITALAFQPDGPLLVSE